jgi:hypothetical protein
LLPNRDLVRAWYGLWNVVFYWICIIIDLRL